MAVTLTAAQLAAAIRVGDTPEEAAQVERLLATATALVLRHAPDAPGDIHTEAAVRVAGYLFDMPQAARGAGYGDVLRNSGALALMLPWRVHRAGVVDRDSGEDTTTTTGGVPLPGGGGALPGVVVGEPVIVNVGATPAPVGLEGFGRYLVRNRGPAVVDVAVAVQSPGDGIKLDVGDATLVQVDRDAGSRLWLWTGGGGATAAVVAVA